MPIEIIPPGYYPIYEPPLPDQYSPAQNEEATRRWLVGDYCYINLIQRRPSGFWESLKRKLAASRHVEPAYRPLPERYPKFPGTIKLKPGDRILISRQSYNGRQVFQHTTYEDLAK